MFYFLFTLCHVGEAQIDLEKGDFQSTAVRGQLNCRNDHFWQRSSTLARNPLRLPENRAILCLCAM